MKKWIMLISLALCSACAKKPQDSIVKQTYIHQYGVPITASDWEKQEKNGQIVEVRSDGVTVSTSYENGIFHGETSYTFPNNNVIFLKEIYDKGLLVKKVQHYPNGLPFFEETLDKGERIALSSWYEDGIPSAIESYSQGYLISGEYHSPLNLIEAQVIEGNGTRICRRSDGEFLSKETIQKGLVIEQVTYYSNGDPSTITPFEEELIHGTRLTFFPGGVPNTVEEWAHGKQEGMTIIYRNGEKIAEVPYTDGKKHGIEYRYRNGSVLVEEISWKQGTQHGLRNIFIDDMKKTEWYHHGEIVSRSTFERLNLQ